MHEFMLSERLRLFPKISTCLDFLRQFQLLLNEDEEISQIEASIRLLQGFERELLNPTNSEIIENLQ
jgi:hypothetical protein